MREVTVTYAEELHSMQLVQPPSWFSQSFTTATALMD